MTDAGLIHAVALGGLWLFVIATALAPRVNGWFMAVTFWIALAVSWGHL